MRLSFRLKTILGIALIEAVFLSILIVNSLRILSSSHLEELNYRASTLASVFSDAVADAVLSYDIATLESLADGLLSSREVFRVEISDTRGVLLERSKSEAVSDSPDEYNAVATNTIDINGTVYGSVTLLVNGSYLDRVISEAQGQSIRIALLEIALVALASLVLGAYLTSQLSKLQNEIRNFKVDAPGDDPLPDNIPDDDIGQTRKIFLEFKSELVALHKARENMLLRVTQLAADNSRKESWLNAIINQINDGVLAFDAEGVIHYVNRPAREMLGFGNESLVKQNLFDLPLTKMQKKRVEDFIIHSPAHRNRESLTRHRNEVLYRKDGESFTSLVTLTYLRVDTQDYFIMTLGEEAWRKQVEEQMLISDAIRSGILESSVSGIVAINQQDEIIEFNPSAEQIFGYRRSEVIGKKMADLLMPEHYREAHRKGMEKYLQYNVGPVLRKRIEITAIDRNQREFPIELAVTPIETENGSIFTAAIDDITNRIRDKEVLEQAKESAVQANNEKSRFLAAVSHEIRTPLNVVLGMIDLLQGTEINQQQQEFLASAENAGRNLLDMINDVLDLSKIEAGKMAPNNVDFDPVTSFEQTVGLFKQRCWSKSLRLHTYIGGDLPATVFADPSYFRQILSNLIANAINYTDAGYIFVSLHVSTINGLRHVCVEVKDTGIGLSEEAQQQLFQEYSQVHESTPKRTKGTGLGLVISRQLANLIGGDIALRSEEGKGSTFTLQLPVGDSAQYSATATLSPMNACLVTEDSDFAGILQHQLEDWGVAVRVTGVEGSQEERYENEMILIDVASMSEHNLKGWIENIATHSSPLAVVALVEADIPTVLRSDIISDVVQVPFSTERFRSRLTSLTTGEPELYDSYNSSAQERDYSQNLTDVDELRGKHVLLVDDSDANRLIAATYLQAVGCVVAEAENGQAAIDRLREVTFDVILMDMRMPVLGGVEATGIIRAQGLADHTPIIALTAHAMEQVREQCLAVGMQDFLTKPIDKNMLLDTIRKWVNRKGLTRNAAVITIPDHSKSGGTEVPLFNPDVIYRLIEDTSREAVIHMLDVFFTECDRRIELMRDAINNKEPEMLENSAHALKSSAGTFGAEKLSVLCKKTEHESRDGDIQNAIRMSQDIAPLIAETKAEMQRQLADWWSVEQNGQGSAE